MIHIDGPRESIQDVRLNTVPKIVLGGNEESFESMRLSLEQLPLGSVVIDRDESRLMSGDYYGLGGTQDQIRADFIENELMSRGRTASMNGVRFGHMVLSSSVDAFSSVPVAVKPMAFCIGPDEVINEWAANNYMNRLGQQERAFKPFGVWRGDNGVYQLLSIFDGSVVSYDNTFWATSEQAKSVTRPVIEKALKVCHFSLGLMLGAGGIQIDTRAKNLARDMQNIRYIDLTEMELIPKDSSGSVLFNEETKEAVLGEIETFAGSCLGSGGEVDHLILPALKSREVRWECYAAYLLGKGITARETGIHVPNGLYPTRKEIETIFDNAISMVE